MSAETQATCPQCGAALSSQSPGGLCPRCLMAMNLATHTDFGGEKTAPDASATTTRTMPSPESLAALFPQLEITECLGRGGMGVVYKARQPRLNRWVALKILAPERGNDPAFAERFEKEAQALARLNHPNIVTVHDFGETNGSYFLLMEFVDGVTLRQLLDAGRVAPREALAIVPQICDALQFAHDHGIVHRDIKPENILMDRRGRVKVADFGLAKIVGTERGSVSRRNDTTTDASAKSEDSLPDHTAAGHSPALLTDPGKVMGTPHYMAPEQVARPGDVDHRADIYALGVVFYQMLTGELPGKRVEPPSQKTPLDARLDEVVLRALEQNPAQRYQQASVLKTHVETLAKGAAPPQISAPPRLSRWQFIALTTFHVIAATLLLLVGWGAFEMGIFFNVLVFFILLMVLVRGVTILWHLFHGTLETGFWRRPFARELRRHRWQLANHWTFWLLAGVVLEHCVVPAQFSTGEYTVIHTLVWGGIVTLLLLNLLPGKRIPVATNLAFAVGSIFMATQLTRIHWPRDASDGVVLTPPFRGEWVVINGGPSKLINIHYGTRNQSLALDLDRLAEGRVRPGNRLDVASYPAWGETVFAPANGRITKVISNRIDNAIGQDDSGHPAGNYVVIDLGNDRFVMMAHLQQDSIVVAEGDTVKIGDPIARVGNSGNTTGPHLHLQVQNHPDFRLVTETYPILFRDAERIRSASSRTTEPFFVRRNDRISAMINNNSSTNEIKP